MSGWTAKRFWKEAAAVETDGGFTIRLDGKPVKTPAKAPLTVPTLALAQAIAAEWDAQAEVVRPETMPMTRMANSSIDKVAPLRAAVIDELARYGGSDLLCYRAAEPPALVERQSAAWDPLLDWAATDLRAPLVLTFGVMPVAQPEASLERLAKQVARFSDFELSGLHDLVAISGSLVLGLAVADGHLTAEAAFGLSRIDNDWQAEQWGTDEDEAENEAARRAAFMDADRFSGLCR